MAPPSMSLESLGLNDFSPEPNGCADDASRLGDGLFALAADRLDQVAADDRHVRCACRARHRVHDSLQVGEREAFLQNEARREVQRARAHHREARVALLLCARLALVVEDQQRQVVALGDGPAKAPRRRPRPGGRTSELDDLASRLGDRFDTRVTVALGRTKGRLSIDFASVEDLNRIIALMAPEVRQAFTES